jgi:Tol biopolymer transport system component
MSADGGDQIRLVDGFAPSFSPNGHRVAYQTGFQGRSIVTVRTDGTDPRRLVTSARKSGLADPQYSPTGRRIAFSGTPKGKRKGGVWSIRRDGSGLRRLTVSRCDAGPDYSPNARRIVFTHGYCREHPVGIYVMRADGSHERAIPDTEFVWRFSSPAWAPAGGRIVASFFLWDDQDPDALCIDLHTMSPKGSDRQRVTNNCPRTGLYASEPSWQPLPASP